MELSGMPGQGLRVKLMATRSTSTRKAAIVERLGTCTLRTPSLMNLAITWEWREYPTLFRETLLKLNFQSRLRSETWRQWLFQLPNKVQQSRRTYGLREVCYYCSLVHLLKQRLCRVVQEQRTSLPEIRNGWTSCYS